MTELENIYAQFPFLKKLDKRELAHLLASILVFLISPPKTPELMDDSLVGSIKKAVDLLDKK